MVRGLGCPAACGILVPRPGIEPVSPALEGGFLTTGPPVKSQTLGFFKKSFQQGARALIDCVLRRLLGDVEEGWRGLSLLEPGRQLLERLACGGRSAPGWTRVQS